MQKRNSIFFDHEERRREMQRISMVKAKISISPRTRKSIFIPKTNVQENMTVRKKKSKPLSRRQKFLIIIKKSLVKYSKDTNQTYCNLIMNNIFNKNSCQHGRFKEMLLSIDNHEFIYKYYNFIRSSKKIDIYGIIMNSLNKIYPSYLGMGFFIYNFMSNYLIIKQKLIDKIENQEKKNERKQIQNYSFSLNFFLEKSINNKNKQEKNSESKINNEENEEKKSEISTKEITKLIYNIITCEKNKKNKEKEKEERNNLKSQKNQFSEFSDIPILFNSPIPIRNKSQKLDFPEINKIPQSEERYSKKNLDTYIKNYQEKNLNKLSGKVIISKEDKLKINKLFYKKKKPSFDFTQLISNPELNISDKIYFPKSKTERTRKFRKTKDFILNSKEKREKNNLKNVLKEFSKNPSKLFETIEDLNNVNRRKIFHKRNLTNKPDFPLFLKPCSKKKNYLKVYIKEGYSLEVPGSPKLINNKIKRKIDIWNLKQNSRNKQINISSNYYYNKIFNSDENQTIEKTVLKYDNIDSFSTFRSNFSSVFSSLNNNKKDKGSTNSIFQKKNNKNHYRRNNSSFNFKRMKINNEYKDRYDNINL